MSKSQHSEGWLIYDYMLVLFSHLVMSDSLWPHGLHHSRLPCPSPSLGDWSNSCPSSQWCHPTISFSIFPFSPCLQFLPASGSLTTSWLFASGGQSIGVSAFASVLPMNTQDWSPLGWTGGSPCSPRDSQKSSPTPQFKSIILQCSDFFMVQLSHSYMTTGKTTALTRQTSVGKVMSLLFNKLPSFIIAFLPRSKYLLIPWLQSPSAVILEPKKEKSVTFSLIPHLFAMKWWDWMPWSSSWLYELWNIWGS